MPPQDDSLECLLDEMDGVFVVATDDGTMYRLDMDQRLVTRSAEVGPGVLAVVDSAPASLLTVATCRIGAPMVLLIDRNVPGVRFTRRTTANVIRIEDASTTAHAARRMAEE
ncbi:hypothetical protein ACFV3I_13600 [Microbacterium sp. NPDC059771]|uniref:hypothetical protein n=1 Tax=Microbacterium sp. NPDC059771 TaxID=3346941 RepID=UPI00364DB0C4